MSRYDSWILENYPTSDKAYGKCREAAQSMVKAFPELAVTNGFVYDALWGEREHWWCKDQEGAIVDPTRCQFPAVIEYQEVDNDHPVRKYPRERCHECGEHYYRTPELGGTMHNDTCHRRYIAHLNSV